MKQEPITITPTQAGKVKLTTYQGDELSLEAADIISYSRELVYVQETEIRDAGHPGFQAGTNHLVCVGLYTELKYTNKDKVIKTVILRITVEEVTRLLNESN